MNFFSSSKQASSVNQPPGSTGFPLGHSLAFHSNAERLICERLQKHDASTVRLNVINRNVALVTNYKAARAILDADSEASPSFSAREAYVGLLGTFYPRPNILLQDCGEADRLEARKSWESAIQRNIMDQWPQAKLQAIIDKHLQDWNQKSRRGAGSNLYKSMKSLSQEMILMLFLGLDRSEGQESMHVASLSDSVLKGSFSLPISIPGLGALGSSVQSNYARGLNAKAELDEIISARMSGGTCPFSQGQSDMSEDDIRSHTSLFASSLVVKCLASYLTSLLLQLYHLDQSVTLETLLPIQLETERLCPPLIGVLRRALKDWSLPNEDLSIPKSWDAWLYFPQCNRDPTVFKDPNLFQADRYQSNLPHGLAFSQGSKICPGIEVIRRMSGQVAMSIGGSYTMSMDQELPSSLQTFLGWQERKGNEGYPDVKQLPVQRPRKPVLMKLM